MTVQFTVNDDVAEVVLDDPAKLNALDETAIAGLSQAYTDAAQAGVRALLLRGEGRAFCAGRDISHVDPATDDAHGYLADVVTPLLHQIAAFPAPTFAVATGACLGVGLGLLIATDVVYVADTARIGSPFARLGATLDSGGHALFVERLGAHRTLDLIYTGELMTGTEAVALGLFSRVVPTAEVLPFARERAHRVAEGPTSAFLASKELVRRLRDERIGLWESVADENAAQGALCAGADYREGFAAFQEKREPVFTGGPLNPASSSRRQS
jgi:Enoyl-CoA hydratase/carnithine racemase